MPKPQVGAELRIGIIGFDTSHVPAFTKLLNDSSDPSYVPGGKVVAGFPSASPDLPISISRVEDIKRELTEGYKVALTNSIEELVEQVDAILLESVDGRRHLAEARPVIEAGKPLFIDKPLAANYDDARLLARLAEEHGCPIFSSSALRFDSNIAGLRNNEALGEILACDAFSPGTLDATNPGLFWYGIHAVEILYTFMGQGCDRVRCLHLDKYDLVTGIWPGGRPGTVRATRCGANDFGATVFGKGRVLQSAYNRQVPLYSHLLKEVVPFFHTGRSPVPVAETLEMMAFMQAALLSQQENREVALAEITQR